MEYRKLGNTGLEVSILSFGASSLGGVFHSIDDEEGIEAVLAAVDCGINFIDVSPYYGFYKAEEVLGKALRKIPRDKYFLSTKVGRYGLEGKKEWDYSAARSVRSVEESMERLGIDYIDLINCHDIEFSNLQQIIEETLPALHELKSHKLVGHVGITGLPLDKLRFVTENSSPGQVETILSFCHYCLNDNALIDELPFYKHGGIGIINASPLSMGLLSSRGAPDWHPGSTAIRKYCDQAARYCETKGYPIEKLAMRYAVENSSIATTLVSTSKPDNIRRNVAWALEESDPAILEEVLRILNPIHRETWLNS